MEVDIVVVHIEIDKEDAVVRDPIVTALITCFGQALGINVGIGKVFAVKGIAVIVVAKDTHDRQTSKHVGLYKFLVLGTVVAVIYVIA